MAKLYGKMNWLKMSCNGDGRYDQCNGSGKITDLFWIYATDHQMRSPNEWDFYEGNNLQRFYKD